jgi:metabolite-proton symporter
VAVKIADTIGGEHQGERVPMRTIAGASLVGTAIEAFDFVLYGTTAALVFNKVFFPSVDPLIGTLAAFATFGVGFLARPVGGLVFGHYGDKLGRKAMLIITLLLMGGATFLIGLLPTYESVGILAPILLVLLRLIQGFAVGGEWGGAVLMATEHAPKEKRGFYGAWPQIGFSAGLLMSTIIIAVVSSTTSEAAFLSWGWRIPFLFSIVLVAVGLYIRVKIAETPAFSRLEETHSHAKLPAIDAVRNHPREIVLAIGMRFSENITFYMVNVFALAYATEELGIPRTTMLIGVCVGAALGFVVIPFYGHLSDRVGRRRVYLTGAVASVVLAFVFFGLLQTESLVLIVLAYVLVMNTAHDAQYGAQAAFFSEFFSTRVRYSGMSISAQVGGVLAGGFAPFIATALLAAGGGSIKYVLVYFAGMCAVSAVAAYLARETYQRDLVEEGPGAPALATG